ncbi:MAG TPA: FAD-binding oxidoreductase [Burkholderiales bacterium]
MAELLERLRREIGDAAVLAAPADWAPYAIDWRRRYSGRPLAVVKPASTAEVAAVVRACAEARAAVVPQAGNTSLCGAATPDGSGTQVVLNVSRLNRVRSIDAANNAMTAEAGCVLASLHDAARGANRLFPLTLAAQGSCELGGNLSTNAGGTGVLRYGNARDLVLGLEVVLPSGEVWDGLRALRKDNTGYDLKQLFIGAEGTLGVITAAVVKLFPLPRSQATAVVALPDAERSLALLGTAQSHCGERLTAFEIFSHACLELVLAHFPGTSAPFRSPYPQYALLEVSDSGAGADAALEAALAEAMEKGSVLDAVVAQSESQARALWALRENISEAQAREGPNIKHDVSVPVSSIPAFAAATGAELARAFPGSRLIVFGHLCDGNLHYNLSPPPGVSAETFMGNLDAVNRVVHDSVARFRGSISAEHGIGRLKREELARYKTPLELDLMRAVKRAIDPLGIMNPGKVF